MEREFNLIDEAWIKVMTDDCAIQEISLKEALLNSHKFSRLSGETVAQDFAVLRLILAIMYTVFSRYDLNGNEIDLRENPDIAMDQWKDIWKAHKIPSKPIESYFEKWYDRFWLFDDEQPFYQSKSVYEKSKPTNTAKMIGTLFESGNKQRLFSDRMRQGRLLSYSEAARWLLHLNCFDDIAAKNPTPKRSWLCRCGLVAIKGETLFETILLNFYATCDVDRGVYSENPSWEQDNSTAEFNRLIPVPKDQAALLSLMSRRIWLCREDNKVTGYYLSGGDYFEDDELFEEEHMTLWKAYQEKKGKDAPCKFKPRLYTSAKKIWREFGSIVGAEEKDSKKSKRPGVINWIHKLIDGNVLNSRTYMIKLVTAAVIYDYNQATSLPVIDTISDSLDFHAQLIQDTSLRWRNVIISEIENCDKAAKHVEYLYKNLQIANGRADKDANTIQSGEADAKMQFYDRIDRTFRLWLAGVVDDHDIDEYTVSLEKDLASIARKIGNSIAEQVSSQAIFVFRETELGNNDKKRIGKSFALALNRYFAAISKIFKKAGEMSE